jgi:hypothetical protein
MKRVFVKPAQREVIVDGKKVFRTKVIPMPDGNGDLPPEGKHVTLNSYWYQRERDKDVEFVEKQEGPAAAEEAPAAAAARPKK